MYMNNLVMSIKQHSIGSPGVKSALRTLQILEIFSGAKEPLVLSELARRMGAPKSSCLALLETLTERGYLYRSSGGSYYPTGRWLGHAQRIAEHDPVAALVHASLERLRERSGETAIDAVLAGNQSIYLDVVESAELILFSARIGDVKPLHSSASGRALLGTLDDASCQEVVARLPFEGVSARSTARAKAQKLLRTIVDERERGWSANIGEHRPDVISVAAGLDINGTAHALVIAAPFNRVIDHVDELGELLVRETQHLLRSLL